MITLNFNPEVDQGKITDILTSIRGDAMGGWIDLPKNTNIDEILQIRETAR